MVEAPPFLGSLLEHAGSVFATAGMPEPRREATRLWADIERTARAGCALAPETPVDSARAERFLEAVERRARGEPLAYVTGWIGFRRLILASDRRALIPRPETEGLVEVALGRRRTGVAADIGTGTGAIALALRDEGSFAEVIGIDISADALVLARENGRTTACDVTWLAGDVVAPLRDRVVDLLVSNPPYLTTEEYAVLDPSVREYEPALALPSGFSGLDMTVRLLDEGRAVVTPGGWIALEVDCRRATHVATLARQFGWGEVAVEDDLFGRARYVLAQRGSDQ